MKFMITCDEAATICDKRQYKEAAFLERIRLTLHVLICGGCTLYAKQNRKMSQFFKLKSADCKKKTHCLTIEEKELLKKELENFNK